MSQIFKPNGLNIASYIGGKPRSSTQKFPLASAYAVTFGTGDVVSLLGGSLAYLVPATAYPPATQNEVILGVWQSVQYTPSQPNTPPATSAYWVSGTTTANGADAIVSLNIQPGQVYIVQANATLAKTSVGTNYNLGGAQGASAATGYQSVMYLNTTGLSSTQDWGHVKIIGLADPTPAMQALGGNAWGDPFPWVEVVINNSMLHRGTFNQ